MPHHHRLLGRAPLQPYSGGKAVRIAVIQHMLQRLAQRSRIAEELEQRRLDAPCLQLGQAHPQIGAVEILRRDGKQRYHLPIADGPVAAPGRARIDSDLPQHRVRLSAETTHKIGKEPEYARVDPVEPYRSSLFDCAQVIHRGHLAIRGRAAPPGWEGLLRAGRVRLRSVPAQ